MTTLRRKVLVLASAIVVALAIVVLPGCAKKNAAPAKSPAKQSKTDKAVKGME
jgi:hypothetical protein